MPDYLTDIRRYSTDVNERAVAAIVKYCGDASNGPDSALVAAFDSKELATIRNGFAAKILGLSALATDAGIRRVVEAMKGARKKSRVTFYYLLAEKTGNLNRLD
jgi:Asp/Glu/hydantoin racemase